jgi:uncharacterized protein (DUF3820 family)
MMTADDSGERANIIPFGKYKGRLIEELLLDDPAYLQWLTGQDWFRAKFNILHQVIINRGAESEETLQVRFLDNEFCLRVLRCLIPHYDAQAYSDFNKLRAANLQAVNENIGREKEISREHDEGLSREVKRVAKITWESENFRANLLASAHKLRDDQRIEHTTALAELERLRDLLLPPITKIKFDIERDFEAGGIDVVLTIEAKVEWARRNAPFHWRLSWSRWRDKTCWRRRFNIELKPVVGDDYPAVLRQMKANGSEVLLLRDYIGTGATREQFIKTFAIAGKRVVFLREVEETQSDGI